MLEFIPSEYYRKYCEENGIEFSDREKAAIIWNCPELDSNYSVLYKKLEILKKLAAETDDGEQLKAEIERLLTRSALYNKLEMLKKLAAETDDGELKAEIGRLLTYYEELDKEMRDNSDKSCIYDTFLSEFCLDFEEAFQLKPELDKKHSQSILKYPWTADVIKICKVPIYRKPTLNEPSRDRIEITYDYEGRMLKCDGVHVFVGEILSKNYVFKHPFKRGDIVMDVFRREIGVVEEIITELPPNLQLPPYSFRFGISVEFITNWGDFRATTICPAELEKLESFDREGPEADTLRAAAAILSGAPSDAYDDGLLQKLIRTHLKIYNKMEKDIYKKLEEDHRIFADDKKD